ncbi:sigma factor-binding protein Crl [Zobellella endophytica]|uniref:Sigma factor-binding protein Crl n=1 Tax=Zobellella endophytica TaxID=2116700 RepID=A0A2P7R3M1_9GAMM|nr:sigma factor-binding protein Crl [Zobellella endophytica]PSJ44823.1 sigma factor-binding protein Crl [Zobellella endophytica]
MTTEKVNHHKLVRKFAAIGPYLRGEKSNESIYFFDCLAVCASAKAAPEKREFWGWWLTLTAEDEQRFELHYQLGFYNAAGQWQRQEVPKKHEEEVIRTLRDFYEKLGGCLESLSLGIRPSPALGERHPLSVA